MEKFIINGGTNLRGEVSITGAKNSAVAILPATLLVNGKCTINNLPNIFYYYKILLFEQEFYFLLNTSFLFLKNDFLILEMS